MNPEKRNRIVEWITLILALCLCLGIRTLFHACAPKEDGSFMTCHWAEQAVFICSVPLVAEALVLVLYKGQGRHGVRAGLNLAIAGQSIACILVPDILIPLCLMRTMRCHVIMRPAVTVLCMLLAVTSVTGFILRRKQCGAHHTEIASARIMS